MTPQPQSNLDVFGNLPVLPKGGNPFPGLRSFEEDEDYLFFGREKQIDELLRKLRMTRFIAVVGVSGSGKSSLVKCGLIPSLYSGYMALAGSNWKKCVFRPGDDPIGNLAKVLAEPGVIYDDDELRPTYESIIETTLRRSNRGLSEVVRQSELNPKENLLIVVDQFEELFRFSRFEKRTSADKRDSLSFVELLLNASQQASPSIYIVLTMRSDFLGECTSFTGLTEAVNQGQYLVPRMTREERKHAITGPIAVGGADITPRLLTQLLNDVGDNPDQLPILQHALMRTWDYWQQHHPDQPIDIPDYQAIGTMRQALSQHAEEAYNDLKTDRERDICEHLFKALTDKGDERQGTRRPTKMKELSSITQSEADEVATVINVFRDGNRSFLMPPSGVSLEPESIIDISHESLMRIWGRLIRWVDEENQSADIYNRLAEAASLYQDRKSGLWRNPELQFALQWYDEHKPNSAWAKRYDPSFERAVGFLMESKRQEEFEVQQKEKQERQKIRRMRTFTAFLGTAALVSIMLFIYAALKQAQAEENAQVARANALEAEKQTKIAKRQKKVADYEKQQAVLHSQEAETQRQRASEQETLAKSNAALADQRAKDAFVAQKIAEQQEDVAKIKTRDAMISRAAAKKSESKADSLRVLALSRTLAFESQRQYAAGNTEQASLLARQAYLFNRQKDGPELDPDIFNALSKAADDREEFSGHSSGVRAVAAIPGADLFASAGDDMTLRIWDSTKPKEKAQVIQTAGAGNFRSLASSATGKYLAAGDLTGAVTIIERSSGNHASTYPNVCSSS
ncbi:MAG: AAA family ATPase, partial [Flavobacteriales bacterium]|nr:AAA family ATPase [Flavobacteriales bacterium]